jgi:nucleotide-binding universal stress UspA family protein
MKILIGIDDSPYSRAALEFVRKLSWPAKTKVYVVSAVRPAVLAYSEMYVPAAAAADEIIKQETKAHEELVSRAEKTLRDAGVTTEARVLIGDPREAIIQTARDEGIDLIVVGSHGRSGITKLLMGSVATHVVTHAPCSVMVVKDERSRE